MIFHSLPNISDPMKKDEIREECDRQGGKRNMHNRVLVGKSEVKRPLGRSRCRWESNIKTDLK